MPVVNKQTTGNLAFSHACNRVLELLVTCSGFSCWRGTTIGSNRDCVSMTTSMQKRFAFKKLLINFCAFGTTSNKPDKTKENLPLVQLPHHLSSNNNNNSSQLKKTSKKRRKSSRRK